MERLNSVRPALPPNGELWTVKYRLLKSLTMLLGAISLPVSFYIGYSFGEDNYLVGSIVLVFWTIVTFIDGYIYLWVLERTVKK